MLIATLGSLPEYGVGQSYPYSHISYWVRRLVRLGYNVVGTGEPGWKHKYRMVERFTQDLGGIEIRKIGRLFRSYCVSDVTAPEDLDNVKEVMENKYLKEIAGNFEVKLKAAITDPVTIGLDLIGNDPSLLRSHPDIFNEITEAMNPVVKRISRTVDIVQFDCPAHLHGITENPWQYLNKMIENIGVKSTWLHFDGPIKKVFHHLVQKYNVEVLVFNFFGFEEKENFEVLKENCRELPTHDKKIGAAVINTQIPDEVTAIESDKVVLRRLERFKEILNGDMSIIETVAPGCGLGLLLNTSQNILEMLPRVLKEVKWN